MWWMLWVLEKIDGSRKFRRTIYRWGRMKNDISSYWQSKNGYMMPVFVQNPYRPEQLIEKYKLTYIKYEDAEWLK